jgi:hypothetical protein
MYPQFVGLGGADDLLFRKCPATNLTLLDTKTLSNGVVILSYAL